MIDLDKLITAAEKEIAKVLATLEVVTGMVVHDLDICDVEVTTIDDTRPQHLRKVMIEMKQLPGTSWDQ